MAKTYDEQKKRLEDAGLWGQTSQYDRSLMQLTPDFGNHVYDYKLGYNAAQTDAERSMYNDRLNQQRALYGGYTGGLNGMMYNRTGNTSPDGEKLAYYYGATSVPNTNPVPQTGGAQTNVSASGSMAIPTGERSGLTADVYRAPGYESPYLSQIKGMISGVGQSTPQFSYNYANDPTYQALLKMYTQNAEVAGKNTLARAAAMTGGSPSTYAVQAATAAGNQELNKLANMIPTLQQQEYSRWADQRDYNQQARIAALNNLRGLEQENYGQYRDTVGDRRTEDNTQWNRASEIEDRNHDWGWKQKEWDYSVAQDEYKKALADAEFAAGYGLYDSIEDMRGLPRGTIAKWLAQQEAAKLAKGKGGGGRGRSKSGGKDTGNNLNVDLADYTITNRHGDSWEQVPGYGRVSYDELETLVDAGRVTETENNGAYTYKLKK